MIISDSSEATEIIQYYIDYIRSQGGYVSPDLVIHCDQSDPNGALSLSGVAADKVSLVVPMEACVPTDQPSLYRDLHETVLGRTIDNKFLLHYTWDPDHFIPFIDMANHDKDAHPLRTNGIDTYYLIGCKASYGSDEDAVQASFLEYT